MEIEATVSGEIVLPLDFPARTQERIEKALSFGNPAFFRAIGSDRRTDGIPERIETARRLHDGIALPRGAIDIVKKIAAEDSIRLAFDDRRCRGVRAATGAPAYTPRGYQCVALRAILRATQGLVIVPCGGGKTTIGASAIHAIGRNAIVLVHTEDLHDQWIDVLDEKLGIRAGTVMGSKWKPDLEGVTVASVPKLVRMLMSADPVKVSAAEDLLASIGVCILDEAHHAPADTFQVVLRACKARIRIGLTATPTRDDGLTRLVHWSFGNTVFEISVDDLVEQGYLVRPHLEVYETNFQCDLKGGREERRKTLEKALMENDERVNEIAQLAARESWRDKVTLVLANRKEYALKLSREMWNRGAEASVITGDSLKSVRKTMMRNFRAGRVPLLIATSIADEGLDCPSLSRIILAWPEAPRSRTIQRIGRLMRPYKETPVFVDVVDCRVTELVRGHEERRKVYRKLKMIPRRKKGTTDEDNEAQMRFD